MHGQALSSAPGQAAAGLAKGRGEREHHGGAHNIQHRDAHGNIIGEYGSSTWTTEERIERGLIDNRSYLQKSHSVSLFKSLTCSAHCAFAGWVGGLVCCSRFPHITMYSSCLLGPSPPFCFPGTLLIFVCRAWTLVY